MEPSATFRRPVLIFAGNEPASEADCFRALAEELSSSGWERLGSPLLEYQTGPTEPPLSDFVLAPSLAALGLSRAAPDAFGVLLWGSWSGDSVLESSRVVKKRPPSLFGAFSKSISGCRVALDWEPNTGVFAPGPRDASLDHDVLVVDRDQRCFSAALAALDGRGMKTSTLETTATASGRAAAFRSTNCVAVCVSQRALDLGDYGAAFAEARACGVHVFAISPGNIAEAVERVERACVTPRRAIVDIPKRRSAETLIHAIEDVLREK